MKNDHLGYNTIVTKDGSKTFVSPLFNETYHSIHGAVQESNHVFIENGLNAYLNHNPSPLAINILEIGFGTGLNCLLTFRNALDKGLNIHYTGVEHYPIGAERALEMEYPFSSQAERDFFLKIHDFVEGENLIFESKAFKFTCNTSRFEDLTYNNLFDIIYFDAFAPSCQAHLWEEEFLQIMKSALKKSGILVTYGSKGSFKRALKSLGFYIESPPGPPGKREMTRAIKM